MATTTGRSRSDSSGRGRRERKQLPLWQETILLLVIALGLAVLIKAFFVQAFYIPSPSMEPQFVKNDRILVQKVSYWTHPPRRGDIIVFKDPPDSHWLESSDIGPSTGLKKVMEVIGLYPAGGHLVKRVIGVGGDEVKCCDTQGRVTVNGHALNEKNYLPKGTVPSLDKFDVKVPKGHLWVMGDNRGDSADSRAHMGQPGGGFIADDLVVGRVFALVWPASRFEIIHRPQTFASVPNP
ncbi:signal peptidase I [Nocardioides mangrovicus]|uniref:Signal peptidase I n=1 Tax=Nocardioides mangrovicus TaxID=2478913 RepID=A0A3L8P060_9ACTN|nr:signal peptidase I [Nocardioides mangrovicus]RLV48830.1 signal peptidase I [Nocardioides mangrovicus]